MTRTRIKPTAPIQLGPSRLRVLFDLWEAGYEGREFLPTKLPALRDLRHFGYAEQCPSARLVWRITDDGCKRLLAPMQLVKDDDDAEATK